MRFGKTDAIQKQNREGDEAPFFARFIRGLAGFSFARFWENETNHFGNFVVPRRREV